MRRKSVIITVYNNNIYYLVTNNSSLWTDDINRAKQFSGIAKKKFNSVKDFFETLLNTNNNHEHHVYLNTNGVWDYSNPTTFSYTEFDKLEVKELFLTII